MKKLIICLLISCPFVSSLSYAQRSDSSKNSELSLLSGFSVIASPFFASEILEKNLSTAAKTKQPIKVSKIETQENNKTKVTTIATNKDIMPLIVDTNKANESNLKVNDPIFIQETKIGYVLNANNSALGIVPNVVNQKDFNQKRIN